MQRPVRTLESPVAFSLDERDRGKARPLARPAAPTAARSCWRARCPARPKRLSPDAERA
jgi:hypothetical protein